MRLPEPGTWKRGALAYGAGLVVLSAGVMTMGGLVYAVWSIAPETLPQELLAVAVIIAVLVDVPFFLGGCCVGYLMQRSPMLHGFILGSSCAAVGILMMYVMLVLPSGDEHAWVGVLMFLFFVLPLVGGGGTLAATLGGAFAQWLVNRQDR